VKLTDLAPQFMRTVDERRMCACNFESAQGIMFVCPVCADGHVVLVWFEDRGVPESWQPKPRWGVSGTGLDDLTISPSIDGGPGCWHGFVRDGEIV